MNISTNIVQKLIETQFPEWKGLPIKAVKESGHDNRTFHLGDDMAIRMPSAASYEPQVKKEARWLPFLAKHLSLPITQPLKVGKPTKDYPHIWSINQWIDGETARLGNVNMHQLALDLANFLKELHQVNASQGPKSGQHNFYRGGDLSVYHEETMQAIENLADKIDQAKSIAIWQEALASKWEKAPVWLHGDLAAGNIIVEEGKLVGVIDFGIMGVGDPACDLVMAWTFFDEKASARFIKEMNLDEDTWKRAKAWALWKALITYEDEVSQRVIKRLDI